MRLNVFFKSRFAAAKHYSEYKLMQYVSQPAFNCSKLTKETLEEGVKYVQS